MKRGVAVAVEGIVKDFRPGFGLRAKRVLHGLSFRVRERRDLRLRRSERRRQDHHAEGADGADPADRRARVDPRPRRRATTESRRHVGFLPENPYFYDYLTGRELLHFYARLSGVAARRRARARVDALLDWVGLRARGRRAPPHLLEGHAAAHRHRAGAGARPAGRLPRRADERPRSDRPQGDPRPDPAAARRGQDRVHEHAHPAPTSSSLCDRVAILVGGQHPLRGRAARAPRGRRARDRRRGGARRRRSSAVALEERFGARLRGLGDRVEIRVPEKRVQEVLALLLAAGADGGLGDAAPRVARADLPLGGRGAAADVGAAVVGGAGAQHRARGGAQQASCMRCSSSRC